MAMYDWNGTTASELGKVYDWDGTTSHQLGKGYDWDGTTNHLIYNAEEEIFNNGLKNGYTGKLIFNTTNKGAVSGNSITLTPSAWGSVAGDTIAIFTPAIDLSKYKSVTITLTNNSGNYDGQTNIQVYAYDTYTDDVWANGTRLGGDSGNWTGTKTYTFSATGTKYIAVRKTYGTSATITQVILE